MNRSNASDVSLIRIRSRTQQMPMIIFIRNGDWDREREEVREVRGKRKTGGSYSTDSSFFAKTATINGVHLNLLFNYDSHDIYFCLFLLVLPISLLISLPSATYPFLSTTSTGRTFSKIWMASKFPDLAARCKGLIIFALANASNISASLFLSSEYKNGERGGKDGGR